MLSAEQLKIDTPEQVALELPVAGVGSRFLAIAVDTLVQAGAYLLAFVGLGLIAAGAARAFGLSENLASIGPAATVLVIFCVYWGYFAFFEILWKGQTPGKRAAGIRVIKMSGRPLDPTSAIIRNLLRAVDFLPGLYGAGVVCMMLNRNSRRIGDLVAGTVVVHDRSTADVAASWRPATAPRSGAPSTARLSTDELMLLEAYLARRFDLDPDTKARTTAQILKRLAGRSGLTPEPGQNTDDFLERVARDARDAGRFA